MFLDTECFSTLLILVAECNNSTAFPGIGLGVVLSRSKLLSDKMLVAAVKAIAAQSPALKDPDKGELYFLAVIMLVARLVTGLRLLCQHFTIRVLGCEICSR